jgi:hypothetical protein
MKRLKAFAKSEFIARRGTALLLGILAAGSLMGVGLSLEASAQNRDGVGGTVRDAFGNPIVRQSAIGAGVGAAAGALTGQSSALKGAGVGAAVGAGTGLVDSSKTLRDKPLVRSSLKGAAIGTGASTLTERSKTKGAAAGAAAGAGTHFLREFINGR